MDPELPNIDPEEVEQVASSGLSNFDDLNARMKKLGFKPNHEHAYAEQIVWKQDVRCGNGLNYGDGKMYHIRVQGTKDMDTEKWGIDSVQIIRHKNQDDDFAEVIDYANTNGERMMVVLRMIAHAKWELERGVRGKYALLKEDFDPEEVENIAQIPWSWRTQMSRRADYADFGDTANTKRWTRYYVTIPDLPDWMTCVVVKPGGRGRYEGKESVEIRVGYGKIGETAWAFETSFWPEDELDKGLAWAERRAESGNIIPDSYKTNLTNFGESEVDPEEVEQLAQNIGPFGLTITPESPFPHVTFRGQITTEWHPQEQAEWVVQQLNDYWRDNKTYEWKGFGREPFDWYLDTKYREPTAAIKAKLAAKKRAARSRARRWARHESIEPEEVEQLASDVIGPFRHTQGFVLKRTPSYNRRWSIYLPTGEKIGTFKSSYINDGTFLYVWLNPEHVEAGKAFVEGPNLFQTADELLAHTKKFLKPGLVKEDFDPEEVERLADPLGPLLPFHEVTKANGLDQTGKWKAPYNFDPIITTWRKELYSSKDHWLQGLVKVQIGNFWSDAGNARIPSAYCETEWYFWGHKVKFNQIFYEADKLDEFLKALDRFNATVGNDPTNIPQPVVFRAFHKKYGRLTEDFDPEEVENLAAAPIQGKTFQLYFLNVYYMVEEDGNAFTWNMVSGTSPKPRLEVLGVSTTVQGQPVAAGWEKVKEWLRRGQAVQGTFHIRYLEDGRPTSAFGVMKREDRLAFKGESMDPEEVEQLAQMPAGLRFEPYANRDDKLHVYDGHTYLGVIERDPLEEVFAEKPRWVIKRLAIDTDPNPHYSMAYGSKEEAAHDIKVIMSRRKYGALRMRRVQPAESQEFTSAKTCLKQVPALHKWLVSEGLLRPGMSVLDVGGGKYDLAAEMLAKVGVTNHVFDPYNRPQEHNQAVMEKLGNGQADAVVCANTLNVIKERARRLQVVATAARALKEGGCAYFSVYKRPGGKGRSGEDAWQEGRPIQSYTPEIGKLFEDVTVKRGFAVASRPRKDQIDKYDPRGASPATA